MGGKYVEVHTLSEGVFALHFVGFARRVQVKVVAQVLLLDLLAALVHQQHPVGVGPVVASGNTVLKLAETHVAARLLETPTNYRLL